MRPLHHRVATRAPIEARIREVVVDELVDQYAGGTQSVASVAVIEGETKFLKSTRPSMYGRYANFEADILAHDLFEAVGLEAPDAEILRLRDATLNEYLGPVVLAIDFVDQEFVKGDRLTKGGWDAPKTADLDSYIKMTLVDLLIGNSDRRGANYFNRLATDGKSRPIPIDNDSAFGNLLTQKVPTNHMNFVKSYEPAGETRGIRQNGTIANMLVDTMLHYELLNEPHEQARTLELAREMTRTLSDEKIEQMVERLPRQIIPDDLVVSSAELKPHLDAETFRVMNNELPEELSGDELFAFRKRQLKETLAWRRDHLVPALEKYFADLNDPQVDPIRRCGDDWNIR